MGYMPLNRHIIIESSLVVRTSIDGCREYRPDIKSRNLIEVKVLASGGWAGISDGDFAYIRNNTEFLVMPDGNIAIIADSIVAFRKKPLPDGVTEHKDPNTGRTVGWSES